MGNVYYFTKQFLLKELNIEMQERCQRIIDILDDPCNNATLILGAGINASSGLPTWDSLLARLIELRANMPVSNPKHSISITLSSKGYSESKKVFSEEDVLELAEYVGIYSDNPSRREEELTMLVRAALASNNLNFETDPDNANHILSERTLGAVARFADKYFRHKKNDTVMQDRSVITFNYDNLLEYYLQEILKTSVQAICGKSKNHNGLPSHLHVFHPHGYLPLAPRCGDYGDKTSISSNLILSEKSYYNLERYTYSWENFILVRALQDSTCIFCGFSGNDYNFKRIVKGFPESADRIEIDAEEHHFILFPINYIINAIFNICSENITEEEFNQLRNDPNFPFEENKKRIAIYLSMKERYWMEKGFIPIWTTYHNIPEHDDLRHLLDYLSSCKNVLSPYEN